MFKFFLAAISAVCLFSGTALAGCGPNNAACTSWVEAPARPYIAPPIAPPQALSVSQVSNHYIAGLGPDERLCPVSCPVNVYNPEGGQVKDCYHICKVAAPRPVVAAQPQYRYVRVIQPIIYVQNAAPYPVEMPCRRDCKRTRYGY